MWKWIILLIVVAALAFLLGRYLATIKTVVSNRDKIGAGLSIAENLGTLFG